MAPRLTFDEGPHVYRLDGEIVPSVTTVIGDIWPQLYAHTTEWAKERGRIVHLAAHYMLKGTLDRSTVDESLNGYLTAAAAAVKQLGLEDIDSEVRVFSESHRFAGTLDILARKGGSPVIADFKTGDPGPQCGLQTAAYAFAVHEMHGVRVRERFGIWLHEHGTFTVVDYRDRNDWNFFLSALNCWRWPGVDRLRRLAKEAAA